MWIHTPFDYLFISYALLIVIFHIYRKLGDVIPIDYGMAFGTATSALAVPELAPCRLTTQFRELIPGLGVHGPMRESMVHTLRVARVEMETLLAALAVFVTEPTVDWLRSAKSPTVDQEVGKEDLEKSISWSPEEVIERTGNILKGAHPVSVTIQDLQRNPIYSLHQNRNALEEVTSILRDNLNSSGDQPESLSNVKDCTKRKFESNNQPLGLQDLTVEQQVSIPGLD